jgi:hypothetical protein
VTERPRDDEVSRLRERTVAVLLDYGTIAEHRVEAERIDPVPTTTGQAPPSMPAIIVFADETGDCASGAGTAPAFDVTCHLILQCLTQRAKREDAVADLDALIAQAKDALFADARWVRGITKIASYQTQRSFKRESEQVLGDGRVRIEVLIAKEIHRPRVETALDTIAITVGVPATPQ